MTRSVRPRLRTQPASWCQPARARGPRVLSSGVGGAGGVDERDRRSSQLGACGTSGRPRFVGLGAPARADLSQRSAQPERLSPRIEIGSVKHLALELVDPQGEVLDTAYLDTWAETLGLSAALAEIRSRRRTEADEPGSA